MKNVIFFAILFISFSSCRKDFIVKDIKDKTLTIIAPTDNTATPNNAVTFWWEALDGAEKYTVQIVKPNFSAIQQIIADTNVAGTKLILSLTPGTYQWRIKAYNNGGSTGFQTYNLKIDTTGNLAYQTVVALSPANGIVSATKTFSFSWSALTAADKYEIQILDATSSIIVDTITHNTTYIKTLTTATTASFSWKVKAINSTSISQYNTPRTFKIDITSPGSPTGLIPFSGASNIKLTDTLKWTRNPNSTDISYDSVYVYTDIALTNIYATALVTTKKIKIGDLLPVLTPSSYLWRVRSKDSVGNSSSYSPTTTFTLIP